MRWWDQDPPETATPELDDELTDVDDWTPVDVDALLVVDDVDTPGTV